MAGVEHHTEIHRIEQGKYIDSVRWLPPVSAFDKHAVVAFFESKDETSTIEIHSFEQNPSSTVLTQISSWTSPSRISSLITSRSSFKPLIAAATFSGSLHILAAGDSMSEVGIPADKGFHVGPVSGVDLMDGGDDCITVGEDGRVNLVNVGGGSSKVSYRRVFDSNGLVSYTAVKWASPSEFVTGGYGFNLQWWDQRKPGAPASQFKGNWSQGKSSGIIHSVDIHSSRKHTCLAGGSSGIVFAWDLRWQKQPIILSGIEQGDGAPHSLSVSEVWDVKYDWYTKPSNFASPQILPAMLCSEDGILAVVKQGEEPIELLAEPCAINSFDIDKHNPSFGVGVYSDIDKAIDVYMDSKKKNIVVFKFNKKKITCIGQPRQL